MSIGVCFKPNRKVTQILDQVDKLFFATKAQHVDLSKLQFEILVDALLSKTEQVHCRKTGEILYQGKLIKRR